MTKSKTIPLIKMAQYRHVKFLIASEKQAVTAYNYVSLKLVSAIKKALTKEKLAKSDDELKRGWTGEIPKIEVDLDDLLGPVIDKHMDAIRWALLGNYAGKDAEKAAEEVGLKDKVTPGAIPSAYIQSLDSHQSHYKDLFDAKPQELPKPLIKESLSEIIKRAKRFIDQTLLEYKNKIISVVDSTINEVNFENINSAMEEAQNILPEVGSEQAVQEVGESIDSKIKKQDLVKNLEHIVEGFETKFENAVRTNTSLASAIGTHQSMLEVYGRDNDELRLVNIEMEDERVCNFCHKISKNPDGSWRYYKLSDLQPSGYNFFRKRDQWKISVAPQHFRCRCQTVYVPAGFEIDPNGSIRPKK